MVTLLHINASVQQWLYASIEWGVPRKHVFQKRNKYNLPRMSLGVSLKGSKRIFDFNNV